MAQENDHLIATVAKRRNSEIRCTIRQFKGKKYADFRLFVAPYAYDTDNEDERVATKKGINVLITDLVAFRDAVNEMIEVAIETGDIEKETDDGSDHE